jgi:hypothetical protein
MVLGPSLVRVLHLSDPPPTAEAGTRPAPPLQRRLKLTLKKSLPASAEDCLTSHVQQIEDRQRQAKRDGKHTKVRHIEEMNELRERTGAVFEEQAARRAWTRAVANEQQVQTAEKRTAALLDYKESHTGIEYWPFELSTDRRGLTMPHPKDYGEELLAAVARKEHQKERQKALRKGGLTSLRLRQEREREHRAHDATSRLAPAEVRAALAAAAARKRDAVSVQAQQRVEEESGTRGGTALSDSGGSHASYFSGNDVVAQMGRMQLREAQRELRVQQNRMQLRDVLQKQAADKRLRDLREHAHMYGDAPGQGGGDPRSTAAVAGQPVDAAKKAAMGAAQRAELEAAILQKQRERHAMRKAAREEQRRLDDAAAREEVLINERDLWKKVEQQTSMALELTKQDAKRRQKANAEVVL